MSLILLKSLMELKNDYNMNFELNNIDTRFSQYQLATLASCVLNIPIKNVKEKNQLYHFYKKHKILKNTSFKEINFDIALTKAMQEDRGLISKAINIMEGVYEETYVEQKPRMKGVVAILDYDYK